MTVSDLPVLPDAAAMQIAALEAFVFRAPCEVPVRTSFGVMHDRPAVLLRVTDADGVQGWGEIWCNFPGVGAEHRARLAMSLAMPALQGSTVTQPAHTLAMLEQRFAILAIQCGEPGPIAQVLAGVDQALWDLAARRAKLPLWRLLGGQSPRIAAYASGLGPAGAVDAALAQKEKGYRAFKLKVGFRLEDDLANLQALRDALGPQASLMVDANQGWSLEQALAACPRLESAHLSWIEEPLRADVPLAAWKQVAAATSVPIAAGENIVGMAHFDEAIASGALGVVQPDVAKWGGISRCLAVARRTRRASLTYCPHYLGAGVGLAMSAHLLAATGGDGMLEVDSNPNPLRDMLWPALATLREGHIELGEEPGIGTPPDLQALQAFAVPFQY